VCVEAPSYVGSWCVRVGIVCVCVCLVRVCVKKSVCMFVFEVIVQGVLCV